MGRQQYLTRLALGRSAFQAPDDDDEDGQDSPIAAAEDSNVPEANDADSGINEGYSQQFDSKGRPVNPVTASRNANMRHAMNSVLALVGVVEAKDSREAELASTRRTGKERRTKLLVDEDQRGSDLAFIFSILAPLPVLWTDLLRNRYQIGLHRYDTSLLEAAAMDLQSLTGQGLKGILSAMLPGIAAASVRHLLRVALHSTVGAVMGRLQHAVGRLNAKKRTCQRLERVLDVLITASLLAVDMALLPFEIYSVAQQLGVAPAFPLLPPIRWMTPWDRSSVYRFGARPLLARLSRHTLTSPVPLLLIRHMIFFSTYDEYPLNSDFTICGRSANYAYPIRGLMSSRLGEWLLFKFYSLESAALKWVGWEIPLAPTDVKLELTEVTTETADDGRISSRQRSYRSTELSRLPAATFAVTIDEIIRSALLLPFQSLLLRAVASCYLQSSIPATPRALESIPHLYAAFGGGPLSALWSSRAGAASWQALGQYMSKLGLCIALGLSANAVLFAGVVYTVRWQGLRYFAWGTKIAGVG